MADRRVTVLNPAGYQEVLQTTDRLFVDSSSQLATTNFTGNITAPSADFTGQITLGLNPTANDHAVTLGYLNTVEAGLTLSATLPIRLENQVISVDNATETTVGVMRFATDNESNNFTDVDAAVRPGQLENILDNISLTGIAPVSVTEPSINTYEIDVTDATTSVVGVIKLSTDAESDNGVNTTTAMSPKNVADRIAAIPDPTSVIRGLARFATGAEIAAGTSTSVAVTPAQLRGAIGDITLTANLPITISQNGTTFDFDINYSSETEPGVIRIATNGQASAGTATDVAITPAQLEARVGGLVIVDATTTEKGIVQLAVNSEVAAGINSTKAVTPSSMRYALDQAEYVLDGGSY
mgnify:CR=1 FL=1